MFLKKCQAILGIVLALQLTKYARLGILQVRYLLVTARHVLNARQLDICSKCPLKCSLKPRRLRALDVCLEMSSDFKKRSRNLTRRILEM